MSKADSSTEPKQGEKYKNYLMMVGVCSGLTFMALGVLLSLIAIGVGSQSDISDLPGFVFITLAMGSLKGLSAYFKAKVLVEH